MNKLNIGIIGSRRRDSEEDLKCLVAFIIPMFNFYSDYNITLVSGGCKKGGDRFAEVIAKQLNLPIIIHYPDKNKLPSDPQRYDFARINFDRNKLIARDSDILVSLVASDRLGGTEHTIKVFKQLHPKGKHYEIY